MLKLLRTVCDTVELEVSPARRLEHSGWQTSPSVADSGDVFFQGDVFSRMAAHGHGFLEPKNALKKSVAQSVKGKQDDEPSIFQPSDERFNENIS